MTLLDEVHVLYRGITEALIERGLTISMMESCTSGLIASLITDTAGASVVLKGAFITYSNEAKIMQGVPAEVIRNYGVYSSETSEAMSRACRKAYDADIGIGVTGSINTVDPNNPDSIPGEAFFAVSTVCGSQVNRIIIPSLDRFDSKLYIARQLGIKVTEAIRSFKN